MIELTTPQPARHPFPTTRATALSFLHYESPDLSRSTSFLLDFGLQIAESSDHEVFLRAANNAPFCYRITRGSTPRFSGFGLKVESRNDLERLAAIEGASAIYPAPYPGGGNAICLTDPSGFTVEAISGQREATPLPQRAAMPLNLGTTLSRVNATQRPPLTPPEVLKLGHLVLEVADFQSTCAWYTRHFGFIPSDVQVLPDGSPTVAFLRLNLGDSPADHHTLALAQTFRPAYSHSAYEVVDMDAVGTGQRILQQRGWQHAWGIGRHILGSQVFDYWNDPWGGKHEHYCDGDVFTEDMPTGIHPVSRDAMSQWGQPMPASFTRPSINLIALIQLLRNLRRSPDLSVKKLITLARIFS